MFGNLKAMFGNLKTVFGNLKTVFGNLETMFGNLKLDLENTKSDLVILWTPFEKELAVLRANMKLEIFVMLHHAAQIAYHLQADVTQAKR